MALENNPLKQYFRRPAIYLKLPSGLHSYSDDIINKPESGELAVYPMTAIDEISSRTPDSLYNGTAMVDIIRSCIPDIKNPWKIHNTDLDAILIAIRSASNGNEMKLTSECPGCKEVSDYSVNLVALLSTLSGGDYDTELLVQELLIKFRPLTYKEVNEVSNKQFESQKLFNAIDAEEDFELRAQKTQQAILSVTELTMSILAKTIVYIKTPGAFVEDTDYILDFLKNCSKETYTLIRDHNTSLRANSEIKPIKLKCIGCQNEYEQTFTLSASDFFG
jgi:hypothetical protein